MFVLKEIAKKTKMRVNKKILSKMKPLKTRKSLSLMIIQVQNHRIHIYEENSKVHIIYLILLFKRKQKWTNNAFKATLVEHLCNTSDHTSEPPLQAIQIPQFQVMNIFFAIFEGICCPYSRMIQMIIISLEKDKKRPLTARRQMECNSLSRIRWNAC